MEDYRHELKHRYRTYFGVYNRYSVPGFVLLFHGICIFGLGCFDIGWTVSRYNVNTCVQDASMPGLKTCGGNHIFTLVGSSLWGGALIIINGVMALWMPHRYIAHSCMFQFYTAVTFINVMVVAPAIVVLNVLEITMNQNVFFTYTSMSGFQVGDMAKFAVVFAIAALAAVAFLALAGMLLIACLCPAPKKYRKYYKRPFADWHLPHPRLPHFPHPHMPHFAPRQNAQGRPMMYNPSMMPSMYGGAGYAPYMAPAPAAMPAPQAAPMALPAMPYYDPYRFYNAMASGYGPAGDGGYGYDRDDRRRSSGRRGRRHRRDSDYSSDY